MRNRVKGLRSRTADIAPRPLSFVCKNERQLKVGRFAQLATQKPRTLALDSRSLTSINDKIDCHVSEHNGGMNNGARISLGFEIELLRDPLQKRLHVGDTLGT
jgi:hypothetical protein